MNLSQDEPTYLPLDKKQVENIPLIGTHVKKKWSLNFLMFLLLCIKMGNNW